VWTATERRALFEPADGDESLVEIVRGRLEGLGPVAHLVADSLGLPVSRINIALAASRPKDCHARPLRRG
jgi:hypothetical protein